LVPEIFLQDFYVAGGHFFADLGWLAWPISFALLHYCLYQGRGLLSERILALVHIGSLLLFTLIVTAEMVWVVHGFGGRLDTWELIVWALVPLAVLQLVQSVRLTRYWPLAEYTKQYQEQGAGVLVLLLALVADKCFP
jgi:glucose dehydrogenase